jgi:hypothetical protein
MPPPDLGTTAESPMMLMKLLAQLQQPMDEVPRPNVPGGIQNGKFIQAPQLSSYLR